MLDVGQKRQLRARLVDDVAQALGISEAAAAQRIDHLISHHEYTTGQNFDQASEAILTSETPDLILTLAEGTERVNALNLVRNARAQAAAAASNETSAEASSDGTAAEASADSLPEHPALGASGN